MKIYLIHPMKRGKEKHGRNIKAYIPPITMPVLAGLTPEDIEVEICDESVDEVSLTTDADLIGITGITSQINRGYEIADAMRRRGKKVVMGGIHVSAMPDEASSHADSILVGEAEDIWEEMIEDFRNNRLKARYQSDRYTDLTRQVIPRYNLLKLDRYRRSTGTHLPRLPLQASRGCPFNCAFCSVTRFWGPRIRIKPIAHVEKELSCIKSLGTNRVFFSDDNFIANIRYTESLLDLLKATNCSWICQVSTTIYQHEDLISEMAEAGCTSVYMGIETFSEENLGAINKQFNKFADYGKLLSLFNRFGIRVVASMMIGLHADTRKTLDDMVHKLVRLRVSAAQFYLLLLLPGTELREQFLKEHKIIDHNWDHQDGTVVTFQPKNLEVRELQEYYWRLYKRFYSYSSIFRRILTWANLRRGLRAILIPLRTNVYFKKRLDQGLHPIEN